MLPEDLSKSGDAPSHIRSDAALAIGRAPAADEIDARDPICVVEDDYWVCDSLTVALEAHGFAVSAYASGVQFLGDERREKVKHLIIDQHMPGMNGLDVIAALHRQGLFPLTILTTGRPDAGIARRAGELGIQAILEKPFRVANLVALIRGAIDRQD